MKELLPLYVILILIKFYLKKKREKLKNLWIISFKFKILQFFKTLKKNFLFFETKRGLNKSNNLKLFIKKLKNEYNFERRKIVFENFNFQSFNIYRKLE